MFECFHRWVTYVSGILSVKILNKKSPSSPGLKAQGMMTYLPGSKSNLFMTSRAFVKDPEVPTL